MGVTTLILLVSGCVCRVYSKGAAGKGGASGSGKVENEQARPDGGTGPDSVKNMGKLANHNWLIYGPIMICICLISLCVMYDKIYRCYLARQVAKAEKPVLQSRTADLESPPTTDCSCNKPLLVEYVKLNTLRDKEEEPDSGQTLDRQQTDSGQLEMCQIQIQTEHGRMLDRLVIDGRLSSTGRGGGDSTMSRGDSSRAGTLGRQDNRSRTRRKGILKSESSRHWTDSRQTADRQQTDSRPSKSAFRVKSCSDSEQTYSHLDHDAQYDL